MKLYLVVETEDTDVTYVHIEPYKREEEALDRIKDLYHNNVVNGDIGNIVSAGISDDRKSAGYEMTDGVTVYWQMVEINLD